MKRVIATGSLVVLFGCSSTVSAGGSGAAGGNSATGGGTGAGGASATGGVGNGNGGSTGAAGAAAWNAGNPDGSCSSAVPSPADTSNPTTVVGAGTAASCTFSALNAAVTQGGIITFDCGDAPVTIPISATLDVPIGKDTVIDGGRLITLDGQNSVRILSFDSGNWRNNTHRLTLQHIALTNGKTTPTEVIPTAPAPCSQGYNDGQGGAVYMRDGNLSVIDCIFTNNHAAPLGPDTGGGAIYVQGSLNGMIIVGSTFRGNDAANAGAVGGLFCELDIYNSLFTDNSAIGHGANSDDSTQCAFINNNQNEVGSGGNGGAIYSDGASVDVLICGDQIVNNHAGDGAFGGGLFFTSNDFGGTLTFRDTTMTGNTGGHWTQAQTDSNADAGTAVGTNCLSLTIENSTLQGL